MGTISNRNANKVWTIEVATKYGTSLPRRLRRFLLPKKFTL
jgi:hypothetical protein